MKSSLNELTNYLHITYGKTHLFATRGFWSWSEIYCVVLTNGPDSIYIKHIFWAFDLLLAFSNERVSGEGVSSPSCNAGAGWRQSPDWIGEKDQRIACHDNYLLDSKQGESNILEISFTSHKLRLAGKIIRLQRKCFVSWFWIRFKLEGNYLKKYIDLWPPYQP